MFELIRGIKILNQKSFKYNSAKGTVVSNSEDSSNDWQLITENEKEKK